ncbi:BglG family transcription antiterminator [Bacillus cereus]
MIKLLEAMEDGVMLRDLTMNEYLDKDIIRQEQLLRMLVQEKRWYQLEELATKIEWSTKTISKDIILLNEYLPEGWRIISNKGVGVCLIKPIGSSLADIVYIIRSKTKMLNIFEYILNNTCLTPMMISKKLFFSYSTVKELLKKLEANLEEYNLTLQKKALEIKGEEFALRAYIHKFYLDIYVQHWPFKNYSSQRMMEYLAMFEKNAGVTLLPRDKYDLALLLSITIMRMKKRKFNHILCEDYKMLSNTTFYDAFLKIVPEIEREHCITFPISEVVMFTLHIMGAKYQYTNEQYAKQVIVKRIREGIGYTYSKCLRFVLSIETKLGINLLCDDEFLFQLAYCFRRSFYNIRLYGLRNILMLPSMKIDSSIVKKIQNQYKPIFDVVKEEFAIVFNQYNSVISDEDIINVTLLIESSKMLQNFEPVKILLYITENQGMQAYMIAWLKSRFQNLIEVVNFPTKSLKEYLEYSKSNLIVTDTDVVNTKNNRIEIVKINEFPTKREEQIIQEYIYKQKSE